MRFSLRENRATSIGTGYADYETAVPAAARLEVVGKIAKCSHLQQALAGWRRGDGFVLQHPCGAMGNEDRVQTGGKRYGSRRAIVPLMLPIIQVVAASQTWPEASIR